MIPETNLKKVAEVYLQSQRSVVQLQLSLQLTSNSCVVIIIIIIIIIISIYFLSINDDRETSLVNKVMKTELTI